MYQLYGAANLASFAPHVCLIKADSVFDYILIDHKNFDHHSDWYKALNPTGRIPVLIDKSFGREDLVLYETAAICLHLADRHPEAGLFPSLASRERAIAYKWLMYLTNTLQTELLVFHYNQRYTSDVRCVEKNRAGMAVRIADIFKILAAEPSIQKAFLAGNKAGICDYLLFMMSEWATDFGIANGPLSHPALVDYFLRVKALPEIQETIKRENFTPAI